MPVKDVLKINKTSPEMDKSIIIDIAKIDNRYKKVKIELNNQKELIALKKNLVLTSEEFEEIKARLFSENESISTLEKRISSIKEIIKNVREQELIALLAGSSEILIDQNFSKIHPQAANYLKDFLLKDLAKKYFKRNLTTYQEKIVDQVEYEDGKSAFLYFSTNAVESLKLNKIHEIVNNQGRVFQVQEIFQSNEVFKIVYHFDARPIILMIPVFYGIIVCGEK